MDDKQKCLEFLRNNDYAVLSTIAEDGRPMAATIWYFVKDDFTFSFVTTKESRKFKNLENDSRVALVVGTGPKAVTVQIEGNISPMNREGEEKASLLEKFLSTKHLYANVLLKLPNSDFVAYMIKPTWIRWLRIDETKPQEVYVQIL